VSPAASLRRRQRWNQLSAGALYLSLARRGCFDPRKQEASMQDTDAAEAIFKSPRPDERRALTDVNFRAIAESEMRARREKTERLRLARLKSAESP
jgi:hypothetical protein